MSVTGYVGLPGSGKTLKLVDEVVQARRRGLDVYTNFLVGRREWALMIPDANDERGYRVEVKRALRRRKVRDAVRARGYRVGRAFVRDPDVTVLTSWAQLVALRVHRDELGRAHRVRLVERGEDELTGETVYDVERACLVHNCEGCSKGLVVGIDELNLWAPSRLWQELGLGVLNRWAYNRKDGLRIIWTAQHEARIDKVAREVTDFIWNCRSLGGVARIFGREVHLQVFHRRRYIPALLTDVNRTEAVEGAQATGVFAGDFEFGFFHQSVADSYDTYEHVQANKELASKLAAKAARAAEAQSDRPTSRPRVVANSPRPPQKGPYSREVTPQGASASAARAASPLLTSRDSLPASGGPGGVVPPYPVPRT